MHQPALCLSEFIVYPGLAFVLAPQIRRSCSQRWWQRDLRSAVTTCGMADHRLVVSCPSDTSGGTDVLTVLGGKSSCRRKFAMAVHLVDAAGTLVPRDLVLHAAVVYHHDHSLVLRGEKAAESPVFTTFNGIEYPATDKPTRMIAGRAAFKLALSLLSSKCDNSLFAIQFSAQYAPGAEQLLPLPQAAYSGPIRSISRKRNRVPGAGGGHPGRRCSRADNPSSQLDVEVGSLAQAGWLFLRV